MKQLPSSSDYINEKGDGEEDIIDTYILMKESSLPGIFLQNKRKRFII